MCSDPYPPTTPCQRPLSPATCQHTCRTDLSMPLPREGKGWLGAGISLRPRPFILPKLEFEGLGPRTLMPRLKSHISYEEGNCASVFPFRVLLQRSDMIPQPRGYQ